MEKSFLEYYDFYEGVCKERLHLQGQNMQVMVLSSDLHLVVPSELQSCSCQVVVVLNTDAVNLSAAQDSSQTLSLCFQQLFFSGFQKMDNLCCQH